MIVKIGNLFESTCDTIVNTVNCVGVMGKGIALEFKQRYPAMYREYIEKCNSGELRPGIPYVYKDGNVRVTLDMNVSSSKEVRSFLDESIVRRPIMPVGLQLLEVKYDEFLPDFIYRNLKCCFG